MRVAVGVFTLSLLSAWPASAVSRFDILIPGPTPVGRVVRVDNASTLSKDWVTGLVLVADRSTREECPWDPPDVPGLFNDGDRIFINDNYLAWFDFSLNDGVASYSWRENWHRGGELAGLWTLDSRTHYFRWMRSNSCGSNNWAHNELIPGSASAEGQPWFWNKYAPPSEHVFYVSTTSPVFFGAVHHSARTAYWSRVQDGSVSRDGIRYSVAGRLASAELQTDVSDNNDANGVANFVSYELSYLCRPRDILTTWKFSPQSAVQSDNVFTYVWAAHGQDEDDSDCDLEAGDDYPSVVYGQPLYATHNRPFATNWNSQGYAAGQVATMDLGPVCENGGPGGANRDIYSNFPGDGDWVQWGEAPDLSAAAPSLTLTSRGIPGSGAGTQASPEIIAPHNLLFAHEVYDGVLGAGLLRQLMTTYQAGWWYAMNWSLHSYREAGNARGDFTFDGRSDILWRNDATQKLEFWFMNGVNRTGVGSPNPDQAVHANWKAVGTADLNNDGKSDILWYNLASTKIVVWLMNDNLTRVTGVFTSPDSVAGGAGWVAVGEADFNQDGRPDIVWRNSTTGKIVVWYMSLIPDVPFNGTITRTGGAFTSPDGAGVDVSVAAVEDFNGDGHADLLLRNETTGEIVLWKMVGLNLVVSQSLGFEPTAWRVVGSGHFNEDHSSDILWRHDDGRLRVWLMDLGNVMQNVSLNPNQRTDTNWKVVGPH